MRNAFLITAVETALLAVLALFPAAPASAQIPGMNGGSIYDIPIPKLEEIINVKLSPEYPKPGDTVSIKLDSSYVSLPNSSITWSIDGVAMKAATGATSFELTARALGETTDVRIDIVPRDSESQTKFVSITPTDLDILWEGDSYVPPFYKGRPMYSTMSDLHVVAIPHILSAGEEIDPENLIYRWEVNGSVFQSGSGYGINAISIPFLTRLLPIQIKVTASALDGSVSASRTTIIPQIRPKVLFYENHPLYGILGNRALLGSMNMTAAEMTIEAVPYFMSLSTGDTERTWSMNGRRMEEEGGLSVTLRNEGNIEGSTRLGFKLRHLERILQSAQNSLTIYFKQPENEPVI